MPLTRSVTALALLGGLAACTGLATQYGSLAGADACGAEERQVFVGQRVDALNDVALPEDTRVLFPGAVADTETEVSDRLTILIGTGDTITRVYCG